uniref:Glucan endo-1,3-beta-glucosidase n=1 Tax=Solanum tuberosum TaxID=4113 RepID=M1D300_SOLTU
MAHIKLLLIWACCLALSTSFAYGLGVNWALQNVQKALNSAGLGDKIKATIPQNADVYESGNSGPSQGDFRSDIRDLMQKICSFFKDNNAPFLVNIYPFLSLHKNKHFPIEFAFFDGQTKAVRDNGISYTNMFDANLDTLVVSLKKASCSGVKIIVGEIGWPTDGDLYGNVTLAKRFYSGFFKKMATKKGTPLYPGFIEYYLFSLTDENEKSILPGSFERHWGIFRYDGKPKFPMDITGQGHEAMPIGAKNVKYLENKWCVLNKYAEDIAAARPLSSPIAPASRAKRQASSSRRLLRSPLLSPFRLTNSAQPHPSLTPDLSQTGAATTGRATIPTDAPPRSAAITAGHSSSA